MELKRHLCDRRELARWHTVGVEFVQLKKRPMKKILAADSQKSNKTSPDVCRYMLHVATGGVQCLCSGTVSGLHVSDFISFMSLFLL